MSYVLYLLTRQSMALAIEPDIIHGRGPRNEMHPQLQLKNTRAKWYQSLRYVASKVVCVLYIANKTERFSFKSLKVVDSYRW